MHYPACQLLFSEVPFPLALLHRVPFLFFLSPPALVEDAPYEFLLHVALACAAVLVLLAGVAFARRLNHWLIGVGLAALAGAGAVAWVASQRGFVPLGSCQGLCPPGMLCIHIPIAVAIQARDKADAFARVAALVDALLVFTLVLAIIAVVILARQVRMIRSHSHGVMDNGQDVAINH